MIPKTFIALVASLLINVVSATVEQGIRPTRFSYDGPTGPEFWGRLCKTYETCSTGKHQSPVNINQNNTVLNPDLQTLQKHYYDANATLMNSGYSVGVHYDDKGGDLTIDGKIYYYKQMHWHAPSEHHINGKRLAAELHLVHQSEDKAVAVVGILYRYGDPNPLIERLMPFFPKLTHESCTSQPKASTTGVGVMDCEYSKQPKQSYYRYMGSLTTPPCTENVTWTILSELRTISREQVVALRKPLCKDCKFNARPVHPLNGRNIELYKHTK